MEYMMADDDADDHMALREEFWPLFVKALDEVKDPVETDDLWLATMRGGAGELRRPAADRRRRDGRGEAGRHAGRSRRAPAAEKFDTETFFRHRGQFQGREMSVMEMKARQTGVGGEAHRAPVAAGVG